MSECPCRDCPNRKVGCHGSCNDYKEWAEENRQLRYKRHKQSRDAYLFYTGKPQRRR